MWLCIHSAKRQGSPAPGVVAAVWIQRKRIRVQILIRYTNTIFRSHMKASHKCPRMSKTCQTLFLPRLMWLMGVPNLGCLRAFWHLHKKRTGDWRELGRGYCDTNANDHFCKKYFVEKLRHKWTCDRRSWTLKGNSNMSKQYQSQKCQKICARKYTVTDVCVCVKVSLDMKQHVMFGWYTMPSIQGNQTNMRNPEKTKRNRQDRKLIWRRSVLTIQITLSTEMERKRVV